MRDMRHDSVVYAIATPEEGVRYVGRTSGFIDRIASHRYSKSEMGSWMRESDAMIYVLEYCAWQDCVASEREFHWIRKLRAQGANLFNILPMERAA